MHQDQKIGLSLAVLLIGFAGAFCFRHEPVIGPEPLALELADEIDKRIEHLPVRAYLEREGVRPPGENSRTHRPVDPDGPLSEVIDTGLPIQPIDQKLDADRGDLIPLFAGPPEPLRIRQDRSVRRPANAAPPERPVSRTSPRPSATWRADSPVFSAPLSPEQRGGQSRLPTSPAVAEEPSLTGGGSTVAYQVRPGDTLSELAQRFLGSSQRYRELYDANRDVLSSPHALREGAVLRIPVAR